MNVEFSDEFIRSMNKLKKRDKVLFGQINKKVIEIIEKPDHYKPLKNVLAGYRRVHFGSFVLIFKVENQTIRIICLDHHDRIY